jgi:hypothetical protein
MVSNEEFLKKLFIKPRTLLCSSPWIYLSYEPPITKSPFILVHRRDLLILRRILRRGRTIWSSAQALSAAAVGSIIYSGHRVVA